MDEVTFHREPPSHLPTLVTALGGWIDAGEIPELQRARHVSFVDIDSGHWPMVTRAGELARIIAGIATDA